MILRLICATKQKINKETQTLNDTIDQLDLIDIYRTFHPKTMNFTFFSFILKSHIFIDNFGGPYEKVLLDIQYNVYVNIEKYMFGMLDLTH